MSARGLPPLQPVQRISRPLSTPEFYHACVGTHPRTLEVRREARISLLCTGTVDEQRLRDALRQVADANPGACLRLRRDTWPVRWESAGPPPRLRVVEGCDWDARSEQGAEFIGAEPLSLEDGPSIELILARRTDGDTTLVLRTFHAVMDGGGFMHFYRELFRALRGEPLLGTNAAFSDVELMRSTGVRHSLSRHIPTCGLMGEPAGTATGDEWRRISLRGAQPQILARCAVAMAAFAHQRSERTALIAVPVDLRRHAPGLLSTTNFSAMLLVPLQPGDGVEAFRTRLAEMLAGRMETVFPRWLDGVRRLPLAWLDRLVSRTRANYTRRRPLETLVVSNMGRYASAEYSCPGLRLQTLVPEPLPGSAFSALAGVDDRVELIINLPRVLGDQGRFDALVAYLRVRLNGESVQATH